jgi:hypothetical protein
MEHKPIKIPSFEHKPIEIPDIKPLPVHPPRVQPASVGKLCLQIAVTALRLGFHLVTWSLEIGRAQQPCLYSVANVTAVLGKKEACLYAC